jgi:hypothetical protein
MEHPSTLPPKEGTTDGAVTPILTHSTMERNHSAEPQETSTFYGSGDFAEGEVQRPNRAARLPGSPNVNPRVLAAARASAAAARSAGLAAPERVVYPSE